MLPPFLLLHVRMLLRVGDKQDYCPSLYADPKHQMENNREVDGMHRKVVAFHRTVAFLKYLL
jgi:hypothetical protein